MSISLANPARGRSAVPPRARARLVAYAGRVLVREGVTRPDVTIVLGDDALLRSLYARYKGKDRTTDVLSFTLEDERAATTGRSGRAGRVQRVLAGEIYLSRDRLLVQAKRYRHSPGQELLRLVTHGLLHLAGHDHMKPSERRVMRAAERTAQRDDLLAGDRAALEAVARAVTP